MNATFYILTLFCAFFAGFLLGVFLGSNKKSPVIIKKESYLSGNDSFSMSNKEYENFLRYDGSKQ